SIVQGSDCVKHSSVPTEAEKRAFYANGVTESDIDNHMQAARAPSTIRSRDSTLKGYKEVCDKHGFDPFPNRKTKRTVTLSIDRLHTLNNLAPPSGRTTSVLAYLTGVMGLLRLKEVVALRFDDIEFSDTSSSLRIRIRQFKTDQSGSGDSVVVGCVTDLHSSKACVDPLCVYHRLLQLLWVEKLDQSVGSSLFGLTYSQLSQDIKFLVETAMDNNEVDDEVGRKTSHSMRRTGVYLLSQAGISLEAIAEYGRWRDVNTVANHYMRGHSGREAREKVYCQKMLRNGDN
ncbi:hypothetical protein FOL47_011306, partial [Perkinsus chesapeaki]